MKILAVSALLCAIMALTAADAVEMEELEDEEAPAAEELDVEKRATTCSNDWFWVAHRSFHFISRPLTWSEAEKNCLSMGGHLASFHSKSEYDQVRKMISEKIKSSPDTWIGGTDCGKEGVWRWSDGSRFDFKQWCGGEPNNLGSNQNCLQMVYNGFRCWDDLWCKERRPSVCVISC